MDSIPQHPQAHISPHEPQSFWNGARLSFRTRRRVTFLFLVTASAVVALLHYSHQLLGEKTPHLLSRPQACQSLDPHTPCELELQANLPPLTVTITHTAPPTIETVVAEPPVEPVVFSLIMISEQSAKESTVLLKSAIMYTSRPLHFHIICDEAAQVYLEARFRLLTRPLHSISVRFYRLSQQSMDDRVTREGSIRTGHGSGNAGLMKLFMHELLPDDVEKAIFADTDAFFLTDPALLWEEFSHWDPDVSISMPHHPDMESPESWHNATRICSCIMLLRFKTFRSQRMMDSSIYREDHSGLYPPSLSPPTFEALFGPPGPDGHYTHVAMGDQTYWWAIITNRTELFKPLSFDWEVTSCLMDMYMTGLGNDDISKEEERQVMTHLKGTASEGQVILPKLLHFNCLDDIFYLWEGWSNKDDGLAHRWKPAVEYHVGFKWLWLNRGDGNSTLDIQTIFDPMFADERFAAEHANEHGSGHD